MLHFFAYIQLAAAAMDTTGHTNRQQNETSLELLIDSIEPSNSSGLETEHSHPFHFPAMFILPLFIVSGLTGNLLVCLAIYKDKRLQNPTNYFLFSLAIADLLVSLLVMPFSIMVEYHEGHWHLNYGACLFHVYSDVFLCSASIVHITVISVNRYIGIRKPLATRNAGKTQIIISKILISWFLTGVISLPILILAITDTDNIYVLSPDGSNYHCMIFNRPYQICGSILAFFIPLVIMVMAYIKTTQLLQKQAKLLQERAGQGASGLRRTTTSKASIRRHQHIIQYTSNSGVKTRLCPDSLEASDSASIPRKKSTQSSSSQRSQRPSADAGMIETILEEDEVSNHHSRTSSRSHHAGISKGGHSQSAPCFNLRRVSSNKVLVNNSPQTLSKLQVHNGKSSANPSSFHRSKKSLTNGRGSGPLGPLGSNVDSPDGMDEMDIGGAEQDNLLEIVRSKLRQKTNSLFKGRSDAQELANEQKATRVLAIVFACFFCLWTPFFALNMTLAICGPSCQPPPLLASCFLWLGYISSTVNPVIYTVFNKRFRQTFGSLIKCRCANGSYRQALTSTTFRESYANGSLKKSKRQPTQPLLLGVEPDDPEIEAGAESSLLWQHPVTPPPASVGGTSYDS